MTNEILKDTLLKLLPELIFEEGKQYLTIVVPSEKLHSFATQLKENLDTSFDYLFCLTGVDFPDYLMVYYHLNSTKHNHTIVMKVKTVNRENPELDTVSDIWKTANFHEREVFDFFGVKFNNHPDLRRIFMTEDWKGYPLRKDYVDERILTLN